MTTHRPVTGPDGSRPISDTQIRELMNAQDPGEHDITQTCLVALRASPRHQHHIVAARTRCAEAYNARMGKEGR